MSKIEKIKQIYNNHINRIISADSQNHDKAVTDMAVEIDKLYHGLYEVVDLDADFTQALNELYEKKSKPKKGESK